MKACPKCAEQVQDDAKICRFCGASFDRGNRKAWIIIGCVFAVLLLFTALSPAPPSATAPPEGRPTIRTTVSDLVAAYDANEAAAQARFGGSALVVTGPVQSVRLDINDKPIIRLSEEKFGDYAAVNLVEDDQAKAAALVKGQTITVTCQRVSEVMGTPILRDCSL